MGTVLQHLEDRYFDVDTYGLLGLNEEDRTATFPLWNLSGELVGYQIYRPEADKTRQNDPYDGRYFTRLKDQKVGVWGLETFYDSNTLFVTEGVFDACKTNWLCGVSAVAVMTATPSKQLMRWFWTVRQFRPVVVIDDGDSAGKKLRKLGHTYHAMPDGIDVGDADEQYVKEVVKKYANQCT